MGRFHCVLDGCAEVWYREFSPERLEYQYSGEETQTIEGKNLTYTIEQEPPPFEGGQTYGLGYESIVSTRQCGQPLTETKLNGAPGRILEAIVETAQIIRACGTSSQGYDPGIRKKFNYRIRYQQEPGGEIRTTTILLGFGSVEFIVKKFIPVYNQIDTGGNPAGNCIFTVFNDDNLIFTRTESSCPTVNYFPSQPSDEWKKINIEKQPNWEKIQVVDNNSWSEIVSELKEFINGDIPDECIEIWKTPILDLDILPGNTRAEKYQFIGQYCSPTGCPPPEYQVICLDSCEAEKCPPGTCEVECEEHICCYDSEGIAILTIDK